MRWLITFFVIIFTSTVQARNAARSGQIDKLPNKTKVDIRKSYPPPPIWFEDILFVEDPGALEFGPSIKPDPLWSGTLTEILGVNHYSWYGATSSLGEDGPPLDTMQLYDLVIWNTYDYWWPDTAALTTQDQDNIASYLQGGGKVWLIGQDLLCSGVPMNWMDDWFHLADAQQDYASSADTINLRGLAEINGINFAAVPDYQYNLFYPDELIPDAMAHPVLEDSDSSKVAGIFYPGTDWMSAFWAMDGRNPEPWAEWIDMVSRMLEAFGVLCVNESASAKDLRTLHLGISPNPLVSTTTINFNLPVDDQVRLEVFNSTGQYVTTLVDDYKQEGIYRVIWHGNDARGFRMPNGVYFVRLTYGKFTATTNLVMVK
jgi:hypothetical protein